MPDPPKRPAPPPPSPDKSLLKTYFERVDKNKNGLISPEELRDALSNGSEDFPFQISTIKAMMLTFNLGNCKEIDFDHFIHVWKYMNDWQKCFKFYDKDKSGTICTKELSSALATFGYNLPEEITKTLVTRFDRMGNDQILFDDFIRCCLILHVSLCFCFDLLNFHPKSNFDLRN